MTCDANGARVKRLVRDRIGLHALKHVKELDLRTVAMLRDSGSRLVKSADARTEDEAMLADVLLTQDHPARIRLSPGPLLLIREPEDEGRYTAVRILDLLVHPSDSLRRAALISLEACPDTVLTPHSRDVIQHQKVLVASRSRARWRPAAVNLFDVLKRDWLFGLAGVRQCLEMDYKEGFRDFLHQILLPDRTLFEFIDLEWRQPTDEHEPMELALIQLAETAPALDTALEMYYRRFGYLPLAPGLAMSRVVSEWESRHQRTEELWETVWTWAEAVNSPLARYHACEVFLSHAVRVPPAQKIDLWEAVVGIPDPGHTDDETSQRGQAWPLRCDLARHFCQHLECVVPWSRRERVAVMAWWLADRLAETLGSDEGVLRRVREAVVLPVTQHTAIIRRLAHPPVEPSALRYVTLFVPNGWALALQARLAEQLHRRRVVIPEHAQSWLATVLVAEIVSGFPSPTRPGAPPVYGWDPGVIPPAEGWAEADSTGDIGEAIHASIQLARELSEPQQLQDRLAALTTQEAFTQVLITRAMQRMVYTGQPVEDRVWQLLENQRWREDVFLNADVVALDLLLEGCSELMVRHAGRWAYYLPHFLAQACEAAADNGERQRLLFALTLIISAASDSVSALQRLLRGAHRHALVGHQAHWRTVIDSIKREAPPWVAARLRAISADLHSL